MSRRFHFGALVSEGHHDFDKADGLVANDDCEICRRNVEIKFAFVVLGTVADAAGVVTEDDAHVKRLGSGRQHVLEEMAETVLQAETEQVKFAEFANGWQKHSAEHYAGMVETCA